MARLPRFFVPDLPLHIVQRGNDRQSIFASRADAIFFRACLGRAARDHGVAIHAYVFMTNHVHLLATPKMAASVPKLMQSLGRIYVQYFNATHTRTGTLWEGRYKAAIVDDERYLLTCMRYIELNPVRAQMVANPGRFRWSSFAANALGVTDGLVEPHAIYLDLGRTPETRQAAYRGLFDLSISEDEMGNIRDATQHAWALGGAAFRSRIEQQSRRADRLAMGRPRKERLGSGESRV
jgi:putative transposase